jgi:hypothetical protein
VRNHRASIQAQAGTESVDIVGLAPPRPHLADIGRTRAANPTQIWDDQLVMLAQPGEVFEIVRCRAARPPARSAVT